MQKAIEDERWSALEELLRGNEREIFGCVEKGGHRSFLNYFLYSYNDPPPDLCAKIVDTIVHHKGVELLW